MSLSYHTKEGIAWGILDMLSWFRKHNRTIQRDKQKLPQRIGIFLQWGIGNPCFDPTLDITTTGLSQCPD